MRSKAPLVLMEQLVMVVVFALTAAICLRMFVLTDRLSEGYTAVDQAVLTARNAAEEMKREGPEEYLRRQNARCCEGIWCISYDKNWAVTPNEGEAQYCMQVEREDTDHPLLWRVRLRVVRTDGTMLFEIPVSGQEAQG